MYQFQEKTGTLNSWKEIASYLGRGVRTVQRWETELQLPVHRIGDSERSPVFAFKVELDSWMRKQAGRDAQILQPPYQLAAREPDALRERRKPLGRSEILERSARLTTKALRLLEIQKAHTRLLVEQVRRMAHLLPGARKVRAEQPLSNQATPIPPTRIPYVHTAPAASPDAG